MRKLIFLALVVAVAFPSPATAESGYRYWSFWQEAAGEWKLAQAGAGATPASAGTVQGWRFVTAGVSVAAELAPRSEPRFDEICGAEKRETHLAIVLDYGDATDYVAGERPPAVEIFCVESDSTQNSLIAISKIAKIRESAGFICALNNFPSTGCGESISVDSTKAPPTDSAKSNQTNPMSYALVGAVALFVGWIASRRRSREK